MTEDISPGIPSKEDLAALKAASEKKKADLRAGKELDIAASAKKQQEVTAQRRENPFAGLRSVFRPRGGEAAESQGEMLFSPAEQQALTDQLTEVVSQVRVAAEQVESSDLFSRMKDQVAEVQELTTKFDQADGLLNLVKNHTLDQEKLRKALDDLHTVEQLLSNLLSKVGEISQNFDYSIIGDVSLSLNNARGYLEQVQLVFRQAIDKVSSKDFASPTLSQSPRAAA